MNDANEIDDVDLDSSADESAAMEKQIMEMLSATNTDDPDDPPSSQPGTAAMIPLRCSDPISQMMAEEIALAQSVVVGKTTRLDTNNVANWFPDWLDGGLLYVSSGASDDGVFHLWRGTHWEPIPTNYVRHDINCIFRQPRLTPEITQMIKERMQIDRRNLDANDYAIYLRDVVLALVDGAIQSPRPHLREDNNTAFIDVKYDAARRDCPRWMKFLMRTLPDDDSRKLLQEIFGYTLLRGLDYQCFFIFAGPQGTGKSTTLDMLGYLLGGRYEPTRGKLVAQCMATKSLEQLGERFGTSGLERALVNVSSESTFLTANAEAVLKRITGGDPVMVEYKNKDSFTASCSVKMIVATNEIPRFSDRSDALNSRTIILPFNEQVDLSKATGNLAASIFNAEGPAILNWALEGLKRLLGNEGMRSQRFTRPAVSIELLDEHRRESNPAVDWVAERLVVKGPESFVLKINAYDDFKLFAEKRGYSANLPLRNYNVFVRTVNAELRRLKIAVGKDDRARRAGERLRVFRGVHLVSASPLKDGNSTAGEEATVESN